MVVKHDNNNDNNEDAKTTTNGDVRSSKFDRTQLGLSSIQNRNMDDKDDDDNDNKNVNNVHQTTMKCFNISAAANKNIATTTKQELDVAKHFCQFAENNSSVQGNKLC